MKQDYLDIIYNIASKQISPDEFDNPNRYLFWFFENLKPIVKEIDKLRFTHIQFFDINSSNNKYFQNGRLIGFPTLYGTNNRDELIKTNTEIICFLIAVSLMQKTNFEGIRATINTFQDRMIVESISKVGGDKLSIDYDDKNKVLSMNLPDLYEEKIVKTFYEVVKNYFRFEEEIIDNQFILMSDKIVNETIEILFTSGLAQRLFPEIQKFLNSEKINNISGHLLAELSSLNNKFDFAQDDIAMKNFIYTALLHSWIKSCKFNYMITSVRYNELKQPTTFAIFLIVTDEKINRDVLNLLHISMNLAFNALNEIQKWYNEETLSEIKINNFLKGKESVEKQYKSSLIYRSAVMQKLDKEVYQISKTNEPVLIVGEVGTGKDLIALEIHRRSNTQKPLKVIREKDFEMDLLNDKNLESIGTIYFPEITDIAIPMQTKLLNYLRSINVSLLNGTENTLSNKPRFIFSSNNDLLKSIKSGKLREDFYFQVNVVNLIVPPLRERPEDIPLLTQHFVKFHSIRLKGEEYKIQKAAVDFLSKKDWKGNVRELEHLLISAIVKSETKILEPASFFELLIEKDEYYSDLYDLNFEGTYNAVQKRFKRVYFEKLLKRANGKISEAAKLSGLSYPTVYGIVRKFKIKI